MSEVKIMNLDEFINTYSFKKPMRLTIIFEEYDDKTGKYNEIKKIESSDFNYTSEHIINTTIDNQRDVDVCNITAYFNEKLR